MQVSEPLVAETIYFAVLQSYTVSEIIVGTCQITCRKIPLISKYSITIVGTRQITCRKIPLISKYSVIIVVTRQIKGTQA